MKLDGWVNTINKLGDVTTDKARANRVQSGHRLADRDLSELYSCDWLSRRIVETYPRTAIRTLRIPDGVKDRFTAINHTEENPAGVILHGLAMGRLYGGAAIMLGAKSSAPLEAQIPDTAKLEWLDVVPRHQLSVVERDTDPGSARFGLATVYQVTGNHRRSGTVFHASRAVLCEGLQVADGETVLDRKPGFPDWISVLQPVADALAQYDLSWVSVGHMIQEASIGVFELAGLIDMLASENQSVIEKRLEILATGKSVAKVIALDSEHGEGYKRESVSFADMPLLMAQISQRLAGAADMPATVLFGMSPAGLNATGESDLTQFYDKAEAYRSESVLPKYNRILRLIDRNVEVETDPFWLPSATERETIRGARANADRTWVDLGVITPEEIRASRDADGSLDVTIDANTPVQPMPRGEPAIDFGDPNAIL